MHVPHDLREEFLDPVEAYVHGPITGDQIARLYLLAGKLWRCTDIMPRSHRHGVEELVHHLDVPTWKQSGTYAAAARHVRIHIETEHAKAAAA